MKLDQPLLGATPWPTLKVGLSGWELASDSLAVEEPLEIRLAYHTKEGGRAEQSISITMRTPGDDLALACGFLLTEGLLKERSDLASVKACGPAVSGLRNVVRAELAPHVAVDLQQLQRHFYTSSSCGVCGKASLDAVYSAGLRPLPPGGLKLAPAVLRGLPMKLRQAQRLFEQTGGLHASGLFTPSGHLVSLKEDVGRHNALDKLIGAAFLALEVPLANHLLVVSGRASFELVQKALMAGIPVLAAVGAPSSLAVALAQRYGMTLLGFVRDDRFNVYCGRERVLGPSDWRSPIGP